MQNEGDAAVLELTNRFDRVNYSLADLRVSAAEIEAATAATPAALRDALALAAARIEAFHRAQLPQDLAFTDQSGAELGLRWTALDAVGIYVPGGKASYPSSVLMNAIPAKVAGVSRIAMCVPAPDGVLNPLVLAAASLAGVTEIYRIGGAQAVAALAYGTALIPQVDKIVGPGNAYVAEAKRQVFGRVGIDSIAGPSEVLILADAQNDPAHVALDLLAQAEHDEDAQALLITDSPARPSPSPTAVAEALKTLPRAAIAGESWRRHGGIILVRDWNEAAGARQPHRAGTSADHDRSAESGLRQHPPCRRGVFGAQLPRGHRRLCRRPQPCASHPPARHASPPACRCMIFSSARHGSRSSRARCFHRAGRRGAGRGGEPHRACPICVHPLA